MIGHLMVLFSLSALVGCSASSPEPLLPERPRPLLGMTFKPGGCVAGANVLPVGASVLGANRRLHSLLPADGKLQFALMLADGTESPIDYRWLEVPEAADQMPLAGPPWNIELSFNSAHAGACAIHAEFQPSLEAVSTGLMKAETTIVMTDEPPPPPPFAGDAVMPRNE